MNHFLQPSFFALCVLCAVFLFALRIPPPPRVHAALLTLLAAGVVSQAVTWLWAFPLGDSTHGLLVISFHLSGLVMICAWLALAFRFADSQGHPSRLQRPWLMKALGGGAAALVALYLTNPWHELILTPQPGAFSDFHAGIWLPAIWGASMLSIAIGAYLELAVRVRSNGVRVRALAIFSSIIVVIASLVYQIIVPSDNLFSLSQAMGTAATLLIVGGIYGTRLIALSPIGLHRVVENQPDGILLVDDDGLLIYSNAAGKQMLGGDRLKLDAPIYPLLAARLRDPSATSVPLDPDDLRKRIEVEGSSNAGLLFRIDDRWLRVAVTRIRGVGGRAQARSLLLSDQTAIHDATKQIQQHEADLKRSEERYEVLFEESPLGVVVIDRNLGLLNVNRALLDLIGAPGPEDVSESHLAQFGTMAQMPVQELIEEVIENHRPVIAEHRWTSRWGKDVHVRVHAAAIRDAGGAVSGIQCLLEDISEQRRLQDDLVHAQKIEAVGQLAGGIAHDFNNYLTVILGNAELLMHDLGEEHPLLEPVVEVVQAAEHSASLTRQLLAFSRKQVFQPRVIDVNHLVAEFDRMLRRVLGEMVTVETILCEESLFARLDPAQLEVVLLNLAINARDAMPDGGSLTVLTSQAELAIGDRRLPVGEQGGSYVVLEVSDTGEGIDKDVLDRIFEPFFTTKEIGQGTGLGLATVHGIVHQSDGFVGAESEPGKGATFHIYLPRLETGPASERDRLPAHLPSGSGTIMLVEDEGRLRNLARGVLEAYGYTVLEAMDGHQALERVVSNDGPIDLLVTDLIMPRVGGFELANRLREDHPKLCVLYMSGYADRVLDTDQLDEPNVAFLQKPFTLGDLLTRVSELLSD